MNIKNLFIFSETSLSIQQTREILSSPSNSSFQILDIRQPKEYANGHIPGAVSIPVQKILNQLDGLKLSSNTIFYSTNGGRSDAMVNFLSNLGYNNIFSLQGGIKAWNGQYQGHDTTLDLSSFLIENTAQNILQIAYALENFLELFYLKVTQLLPDGKPRKMFDLLIEFERKHKDWICEMSEINTFSSPKNDSTHTFEDNLIHFFIAHNFTTEIDILFEIAIGLEIQAFDIYGRLYALAPDSSSQDLILRLAAEEKTHMSLLINELDSHLAHSKSSG